MPGTVTCCDFNVSGAVGVDGYYRAVPGLLARGRPVFRQNGTHNAGMIYFGASSHDNCTFGDQWWTYVQDASQIGAVAPTGYSFPLVNKGCPTDVSSSSYYSVRCAHAVTSNVGMDNGLARTPPMGT